MEIIKRVIIMIRNFINNLRDKIAGQNDDSHSCCGIEYTPSEEPAPEVPVAKIKKKPTVNIEQMLLPEFRDDGSRHPARPGHKLETVQTITIHWIGPFLQQVTSPRNWWATGSDGRGIQASAHFIIGRDGRCIQCIPLDEVAWHAGNRTGNFTSIGIEMCPESVDGRFSEISIQALRGLVAHINEYFGRELNLTRHFDWTGKDCPRFYTPITSLLDGGGRVDNPSGGDDRWQELLKAIS